MVKLSEHFDDFTRQSRVMPVIVASIPLFFAALAKGLSFSGWVETGSMTVLLIAAVRSLKNRANSDREKEFRVYQQLKEYHFYRNLYGIKPVAIVIYALLAFRELWLIPDFSAEGLFLHPFPEYVSLYIFALGILLISFATRKGVEERSYSYGKALFESCERI